MKENVYLLGLHVLNALREKLPVVALETALLTHGLPATVNLQTVLEMERIIRDKGAVPCSVGVLNGKVIVGLNTEELSELAAVAKPLKLGLRELPYAVATKQCGGTTVSATAFIAHRYGIRVFATGGIGGVHRDAEHSLDISSDLNVLGRTPITVVSSGAKAILDLGLTLEYLETAGVTVVGYRTQVFPAFYAGQSPYRLALHLDTVQKVAELAAARDLLGSQGCILLCNPVPPEEEIPWQELFTLVEEALHCAKKECISGQDITPWLLQRLSLISGGKTLSANLALLRGNAGLAAEVAGSCHARRRLSQ
jgi:pseudouridine-5'-phosphate glycosidase